jgi:transglutaminase-like putative cysteine protease
MVRIDLKIELNYQIFQQEADFVFNIHAAHTPQQTVWSESLTLSQALTPAFYTDPVSGSRFMRMRAQPGDLQVVYTARIDVDHYFADPTALQELSVNDLPAEVLVYLYPSRYCQSDMMGTIAAKEFGHLPRGYTRVEAIRDWVQKRVAFIPNTSNCNTSALDTLNQEAGVCRDFAHLMIALCRAVNIPARVATGTDYGADPSLGPPDFHAYVEVWLQDRWYIFDPSGTTIPMGCIRLGTGRDAVDVAIASMFGNVSTAQPIIHASAVVNQYDNLVLPEHCNKAISTSR